MPDSLPLHNPPTRPIWIKVVTPFGVIPLTNVSIGASVNKGREWSFSIPQFLDPYFGDEAAVFTIEIHDGISSHISPELTPTSGGRSKAIGQGDQCGFSGIDLTTWTMTEADLVMGTFTASTSDQLLTAVATKMNLKVLGEESYKIINEDINNQKMIEVLTRVIGKSGQNWYIDQAGKVRVVSNMTKGEKSGFLFNRYDEPINYAAKVDSIKIGKTSRTSGGSTTGDDNCFRFDSKGFKTGQLKTPLLNAAPYDRSLKGYIYYVTTFNGAPGTGIITGEFKMIPDSTIFTSGVTNPGLPTTHFSCVVNVRTDLDQDIDAKLCFTGQPVGETATVEPTFLIQIGKARPTTPTGPRTRPAKVVKIDTLYPSKAFALAHAKNYLFEANRNYRRCNGSGPLDLTVDLFQEMGVYGCDSFICDSYKHDISLPGTATTTVSGVPLATYEWCITNGVQIPILDN